MDWILWIIPPFPIKHQNDDDDDDDDDSLEVWSNVRVGGNMLKRHLNLLGNTQGLVVLLVLQYVI